VVDETTIEFQLPEPYSPFLDATTRGILPAHLLEETDAEELMEAPFNRSPVGTGPFMVASGQDWERSHRLRLQTNPIYWRQGVRIAKFEFRFYPDYESLRAAFEAGDVQAMNSVSPKLVPELAAMPGARLFTTPAKRLTMIIFNQGESGLEALKTLAVRQSLAYALDREALVDNLLSGQGVMLEGPYLPTSWAYRAPLLRVYESQPLTATVLLEESGWPLPEGSQVRQSAGESLTLRLLALDTPTHSRLANMMADQWRGVGVEMELTLVSDAVALRATLEEGDFDAALVDVTPPGDPDLYDFWSQEAIIRGQNYAGWNHRRASEALENARKLWDPADRRPYYETFLRYYDASLPALTLFQHVRTYVISDKVNMVEIGRIDHPRDRYATLGDWFVLYRDVTVSCPADESAGESPSA
jgi:peptide/nickel transport system substrate-binding protein